MGETMIDPTVVPSDAKLVYASRDGQYRRELVYADIPVGNVFILADRGFGRFIGNEAQSSLVSWANRFEKDNGRAPTDEESDAELLAIRDARIDRILHGSIAAIREISERADPFEVKVRALAEMEVREFAKSIGLGDVPVYNGKRGKAADPDAPKPKLGYFRGEGEARRFLPLDLLIDLHIDPETEKGQENRARLEEDVRKALAAEERKRKAAADRAEKGGLGAALAGLLGE